MDQEPLVSVVVVDEELLHNLDLDVGRHPLGEDPQEGAKRKDVESLDHGFSHPARNVGGIIGYGKSLDGGSKRYFVNG